MNYEDHPTVVRNDATAMAMEVGVLRASLAVRGQSDPALDATADRLNDLILRAGEVEQHAEPMPMVAAMERLDPTEFGRAVRLRRTRERMEALRAQRVVTAAVAQADSQAEYHRQQMRERDKFIFESQREGYHVTVLPDGNVVADLSPERAAQKHRR